MILCGGLLSCLTPRLKLFVSLGFKCMEVNNLAFVSILLLTYTQPIRIYYIVYVMHDISQILPSDSLFILPFNWSEIVERKKGKKHFIFK